MFGFLVYVMSQSKSNGELIRKPLKMKKLLFLLLSLAALAFAACSGDKPDENAAARAAKEYYDSLFARNYAYFVRGMYMADTIPDGYREQLEANASMYVGRMSDEHRGVSEVRVIRCVNDTVRVDGGRNTVRTAEAYLVLCFGDSLNEEVVVSMIHHGDRWLMR